MNVVVFVYDNAQNDNKNAILRELKNGLHLRGFGDPLEPSKMWMFCPECQRASIIDEEGDPELDTDDYVTHPMISCCVKSVLLPNTAKIVQASDVNKEYIRQIDCTNNMIFITVRLAFIKKIIDNNLGAFECDVPIPDDAARKFSDAYYECKTDKAEFVETNEIAKQYGIRLYDWHFDDVSESIHDFGTNHESKFINAKTLNIGIKVNSYDVLKPASPYPRSTNLTHADTVTRLLCIDENSEEFYVNFWS